jgi:hypothetical protein
MPDERPRNCHWHDTIPCPFGQYNYIREFEGRRYCQFHMPLRAPDRLPAEIQQLINGRRSHDAYDLRGVQFPANRYEFAANNAKTLWALGHCRFADGVVLIITANVDLCLAFFEGDANIDLTNGTLTARGVEFPRYLTIFTHNQLARIDLSESKFRKDLILHFQNIPRALVLEKCEFTRPPVVHAEGLPQVTSFIGAKFARPTKPADDEGRHRSLRNYFNKNRARDMEGVFYAHEKKCQRLALPKGWRYWAWRSFSALYDWTANYGQSYERALAYLMGVQIAFGFSYALLSGRFSATWQVDWQLVAFTWAQLVRPFEFFSIRAVPGWPYAGIVSDSPGWWAPLTAIHSLLSFTALALFFIALRWRFRRE